MATSNLVSVSEQQLVDCDKVGPGCNDGIMNNANYQLITSSARRVRARVIVTESSHRCNSVAADKTGQSQPAPQVVRHVALLTGA